MKKTCQISNSREELANNLKTNFIKVNFNKWVDMKQL